MNQAIVLGSGTSNGIPMLGYHYAPGYLDNPKNHRSRCALLLQGPSGNVLIDCPPELRLQLTKENIDDLEAVIITHSHADHVMGMDDLRSICILRDKEMPIYSLPNYLEDVRRIFPYAFREPPPGLSFPRFKMEEIKPRLQLAGLDIDTFVMVHGDLPVVGIRVNELAYITDVSFIPEEVMDQLEGLDVLILDALRFRPHPNHFNLEQALEVVKKLNPKNTYLTHLTHDFDHDKTNQELPANVELAYDGLKLSF